MNLKTKAGTAEPFPLTDIQENNKLLKRVIQVIVGISLIGFFYLFWLTYYVIKNNVVNNIVRACV